MFYYINGIAAEIYPQKVVLDCGGVGFELNASNTTLGHIKLGEKIKLYIYNHIKDDLFDLYGFYSQNEKRSFELLLGVSGVGPKAAMSILSSCSPETLAMAIISEDEKTLTMAPGIGKKIAQRIILELRDKVAKETKGMSFSSSDVPVTTGKGSKMGDTVAALSVLGFTTAEISAALNQVDMETLDVEGAIKAALKLMTSV